MQISEYCYSWKVRFVLFVPIQIFFWCVNYTVLVCRLCLLFQIILDLWPVLILKAHSSEISRRVSFNCYLLFSCFVLVCKLYKLGLYITTYFEHGQCFIWGFLVFSFLVFSVYKNPKSNHHLLFLAIFPDLEMLQFLSVNYICQVCKLYFYFGHVQNFGQYLYLSICIKKWKCPTFSFC